MKKKMSSLILIFVFGMTNVLWANAWLSQEIEKNDLIISYEKSEVANLELKRDIQSLKKSFEAEKIELEKDASRQIVSRGSKRSDSDKALILYIERMTGKKVKSIVRTKFEVTKYSAEECGRPVGDKNYGMTASGRKVYDGMVSAPKNIPFGSAVLFDLEGIDKLKDRAEGRKIYDVQDRGGAIKNKGDTVCIDIYGSDNADNLGWGRQKNIPGFIILFEEDIKK